MTSTKKQSILFDICSNTGFLLEKLLGGDGRPVF